MTGGDYKPRLAEVRRRLKIAPVVEQHVKLSGSPGTRNRRGKCPFHGSNSASFSVKDGSGPDGFGHCFGCGWHGDVVRFTQDMFGLNFMDALAECERRGGITDGASGKAEPRPVTREKQVSNNTARRREFIEPIDMGRAIWRRAVEDPAAVRRYFLGRGVPENVLTDARMRAFRYLAECPCTSWEKSASPKGLPIAPAIMALVKVPMVRGFGDGQYPGPQGRKGDCPPELMRGKPSALDGSRPALEGEGGIHFNPTGLHVTYLNPAGDGTMLRRKPWAKPDDADPYLPKRRMLGPVKGGAVLLGEYDLDAPIYVGEGNETVLSGMALAGADDAAVGVATLSLDNLQGGMRMWANRTWPLHQIEPDGEGAGYTIPGHRGPVTGLVDSDMSPLRGLRDRDSGEFLGEKIVTRKGGLIERRAITGAERATICAELFVKHWRAAGSRQIGALRAPMGMDFNDAARAQAAPAVAEQGGGA